jgi:glutamyl-tRNA synthetase
MTQVVTRFAPSPTGFLHIGGARTALFNWLYAKRFGGVFLLRIEDTDRERSTRAAVEAIIDGLRWLGLNWDGEAISQFARAERHREVAYQLLAAGAAYRCYASAEELESMREKARLEGTPKLYDGRWRDRDPALAPPGVAPVIRLRARQDGETVIDDRVQGKVTFANKDLDDLVLLRSDGNPTYMLAVVVDDHDMGVTQIIRGDDHLTNAARQTQIYQALGWDVPAMAHIPLIHGPDGAKLSKRHGALGVDAYRAMGYLPAALRNYLARLGWSHGDKEFFTTEELIAAFDLSAVGRSPSRFDYAKLENVNGHYMRAASDGALYDALIGALPYLPCGREIEASLDERKRIQLRAAIPGLKERAKTLVELLDGAAFLFAKRPLTMDAKAEEILARAGRLHLKNLLPRLAGLEQWSPSGTEGVVRAYAEEEGAKLGSIAQPLRAALTGRSTSPGIFDVTSVLPRYSCGSAIGCVGTAEAIGPGPAPSRW